MQNKSFGIMVASVVSSFLGAQAMAADAAKTGGAGKPAASKPAAAKCVHSCSGHAECKGNGNNECKGKNTCANNGIVPKACSAATTEQTCNEVKDAKKQPMCTWAAN